MLKLSSLSYHLRRVVKLNGSPKIFSWGSAPDTSKSGLLLRPVCVFSTGGFAEPQFVCVCTLPGILLISV
jgi:hypothetical protein